MTGWNKRELKASEGEKRRNFKRRPWKNQQSLIKKSERIAKRKRESDREERVQKINAPKQTKENEIARSGTNQYEWNIECVLEKDEKETGK